MLPRILLVNPPIYDFAAYDFWLKPYGLLSVAGFLRGKADFKLFDYLDKEHRFTAGLKELAADQWGRGRIYCDKIVPPDCLKQIPRYFRRFGLPRDIFTDFLKNEGQFDYVFVQTTMTYWYPGVFEVIEDVRRAQRRAKIVLGGNYVTLCPGHAEKTGADFLVEGTGLRPLWEYLDIQPALEQPGLWEGYDKLRVGVLKLSDGCPFKCTYCSVPKVYSGFEGRDLGRCLAELELLVKLGAGNIAFYDDALLFEAERVLRPFLEEVMRRGIKVNFHSPNALNARFITKETARLMVEAGFKSFYLGFESACERWQRKTGAKVFSEELAAAAGNLKGAGAEAKSITAYQIVGHPQSDVQRLEETMGFVNSLGIRGMLADFSPIPGTEDGEEARKWVDMDEPLMHNKAAFPIILLGDKKVNELKELQRRFNGEL
jgi:radical SAM superfamily enzyme YgiQ (UPF0313 family)